MIEVSPSTAITLYMFLTISFMLGVWAWHHYNTRKRQIFTPEKKLCVCEYCHFAYVANQIDHVNKCPQCHSFNKET